MKVVFSLLFVIIIPQLASAQNSFESGLDLNSGSTYYGTRDYLGGRTFTTTNPDPAKSWTGTTSPYGNLDATNQEGTSLNYDFKTKSGATSTGEVFHYDSNSGYYYNYTTGKTCSGTGAARVCF